MAYLSILILFLQFAFLLPRNTQATTDNFAPPLSCKVHPFLVNEDYTLPFKYDAYELVNGSSKVNPGDHIVYLFEVNNNSMSDRVVINKVVMTQLLGVKEPIEILQTRPQNGSCSVDESNKSVTCDINYSFAESAHYPIEYLIKVTDNPDNQPKTSSMFTIHTDVGITECAGYLWIKDVEKPNEIDWGTPYAKITSSDFYIKVNGKKFYGKDPFYITSDPGTERTTLEVNWSENNVPMRFYLYFKTIENNMWELYEVRSYNGQSRGEWIYYEESLGNTVQSLIGYHSYAYERKFVPTNSSINAEIYCKECSINAFMPRNIPPSPEGYYLEPLIGLPEGEVITLSTKEGTGYGVNVLLKDKDGNVVKDQEEFGYAWDVEDPEILKISVDKLVIGTDTCAYGINHPCPRMHVDLTGKKQGETTVKVDVKKDSDDTIIASTSFPVKVVSHLPPSDIEDKERIDRLEKELERISQEVQEQRTLLQKLSDSIDNLKQFILNIFRRKTR